MKAIKRVINGDVPLFDAIGLLREVYKEKKYFTMTLNFGKKRTLSQNAIAHAWYAQVARELAEYTAEEVKWLCKYHLGIPLLREDPDFEIIENGITYNYDALYERLIAPLQYEDQISAMMFFPVTRYFDTEQHNRYLEGMQRNYARRGVLLEVLDDTGR